ncbi:YceI-like domain protein [Lacunisphaera limnophila]|uniref:YceI-like domain protein n=1 Tax=Lacunisphaera limnophila TaxID=1838286 RepID=A0A1D8ATF0_9BACT|nr:YceI family protein [Lacunisphaera limnophila]AOS44126.1 YceI-like domain protein [Lacunisphaera limnophila]
MRMGLRVFLLVLAALVPLWVRGEAGASPLQLDLAHSALEVEVHATFETFVVRLDRFRADIAINPGTRVVEQVGINFLMADLRTGRSQRDQHMLEWEEHERFPEVGFRMVGQVASAAGPRSVRGVVSLHGVEHEVAFNVTFLMQDTVCSIDGEAEIDYRDHGLPLIRKYWVLRVDPVLHVRFHLQGRLAGPAGGPRMAEAGK